jgi:hypothetical protein
MGWLSRLIRRGPPVALRRPVRLGLEILEARDVPSWSPWESLGGAAKQVVALNQGINNPTQVFAIGSNGGVYYAQQSGGNWAWQNLGGFAFQMAVTANGNGGADVFVVGADHAVYRNTQTATSWTGWTNLGGYTTQVAAGLAYNNFDVNNPLINNPHPEEELFAIGTGNAIFHRAFVVNGSVGGWEHFGGTALKIAVPQSGTNFGEEDAPEVVAIGVNHDLWDRVWNNKPSSGNPGAWNPWHGTPGSPWGATRPTWAWA